MKCALHASANPGDTSVSRRGTTKLSRSTEALEALWIDPSGRYFAAETRYGVKSPKVSAYEAPVSRPASKTRPRSRPAAISAIKKAIAPKKAEVAKTSVENRKSAVSESVVSATKVGRPSEPSIRRITRYTANGTGKIRTRLTWPCSCPAMYWQ